jgi:NAD(P)-dependent dehydrogenase (short-subunit alcohol dehydrogenase family)
MLVPEGQTADGFELHMGTNYLGTFALTNLLLPYVTSRVVSVSSQLHKRGRVDPGNLNGDGRRYNALQAYRDSKLATIMFTRELQRRLAAAGSPVR